MCERIHPIHKSKSVAHKQKLLEEFLTEGRSLSRNYHVWKMTMDRTKVIDDKPCLGSCQQDPRLTFLRGKLFLCFSSPDLGWPQRQL